MVHAITVDNEGDLQVNVTRDELGYITNGLTLGDTLQQDQELLLMSCPGEWKENPVMGVGMINFINDDESVEALHYAIERQYQIAGFRILSLEGKTATTTNIIAER